MRRKHCVFWGCFQNKTKENQHMKSTLLTLRLSFLSITLLALSTFGLAQQKAQPSGAGRQSALVQTVREATEQYLHQQRDCRWIWEISWLRQWLRPWRYGDPLRQCQLVE